MSLREDYLRLAIDAINILEERFSDIYVKAYLFGSVSKGRMSKDSDIDILFIGRAIKDIKLLMQISETMEELCLTPEINVKYYNYDTFKKCIENKSDLFLGEIEKDCIDKERIYELL